MDLAKAPEVLARSEEGVTIKLLNENNEPDLDSKNEQSTITVIGQFAKRVGRTQDSQLRRAWKRRPGTFDPAEVTRADRIERAAAAITAWSGIEQNGEPFPFTGDNAVAVLTAAPWVLAQVEAAVDGHAGFFGKPSTP